MSHANPRSQRATPTIAPANDPEEAMTSVERAIRALGRRTVDRYPWTTGALLRARSAYAIATLQWVAAKHAIKHDAGIDPFRVVRIDPAAVERTAEHFDGVPKFRRIGRIHDGNWDHRTERFTDRTIYTSFEAHFEDGVPWPETEFYDEICARIDAGESWWGCTSRAAFEDRCTDLDALYDSIAERGVRSQAELHASEIDDPVEKNRPALVRSIEDEIAVHVARNGEFLFCDGRNRLAIAKLLDADTIPVRIVVRHQHWQAFRDAVATGRIDPGQHATHPDIEPLLDD